MLLFIGSISHLNFCNIIPDIFFWFTMKIKIMLFHNFSYLFHSLTEFVELYFHFMKRNFRSTAYVLRCNFHFFIFMTRILNCVIKILNDIKIICSHLFQGADSWKFFGKSVVVMNFILKFWNENSFFIHNFIIPKFK